MQTSKACLSGLLYKNRHATNPWIWNHNTISGQTHRAVFRRRLMEGNRERNSSSGFWTNERHMQYLSSMEASFVRTMLENDGRVLRLDRYLPDSSESTLDLPKERRRPHYAPDISKQRGRIDKKTRRLSSQPHTSSQDQLVAPQLEDGTSGENARDVDVPVTLAHALGN